MNLEYFCILTKLSETRQHTCTFTCDIILQDKHVSYTAVIIVHTILYACVFQYVKLTDTLKKKNN
jgi:hypothetical protein